MQCIALLRGINVGGKNMIKMPALREVLTIPGIRSASTWLQSGNIVFDADINDGAILEQRITDRITHEFGLSVTVLVRSGQEWKDIIRNMPWTDNPAGVAEHGHVTFLQTIPEAQKAAVLDMKHDDGEFWALKGREVYLYCPFGYGRTKLTNSVFERKLGMPATTRNWKTILALNMMLDS